MYAEAINTEAIDMEAGYVCRGLIGGLIRRLDTEACEVVDTEA